MRKINISIVGTGLMGLQHIKAITKSKKVKLHSIVDISKNAANLSKKFKIPLFASVDEVEHALEQGIVELELTYTRSLNSESLISINNQTRQCSIHQLGQTTRTTISVDNAAMRTLEKTTIGAFLIRNPKSCVYYS